MNAISNKIVHSSMSNLPRESSDYESQLRSKNLELERYNAEMELKQDMMERENIRAKSDIIRLEGELKDEREKNLSGLNKDQLARMKQVNSFLEHNLRENGEMLQSLAKLHEEKQQMKKANWELQDKLGQCVCSINSKRSIIAQPDQKTFYGKYLRAESFRKALVWQKRYLLVLLCGELLPDPVLIVVRDTRLGKIGKFRAAVHVLISISRMKYLVRRWRTGKRAGAHISSSRAWSDALGSVGSPEVPLTGRSSNGVPSIDIGSPTESFSPALPRSSRIQQNVTGQNSIQRFSSLGAEPLPSLKSNPRVPQPITSQSRNPPTFRRSQSLRSSAGRPTTLGVKSLSARNGGDDNASLSSSNPSSTSSHQRAPAVTGLTPPTKDTTSRRARSSAPTDSDMYPRRNLGSQLGYGDETLAAVGDSTLQRDLENYIKRLGNLQGNRGKHF